MQSSTAVTQATHQAAARHCDDHQRQIDRLVEGRAVTAVFERRAKWESLRYVADAATEEIRTYLERYGENPDPELIDDALREMDPRSGRFDA